MPTILPPSRRAREKRQAVLSIAFNVTLLVSATVLTFVVLIRAQRLPAAAEVIPQTAVAVQQATDGGPKTAAPVASKPH